MESVLEEDSFSGKHLWNKYALNLEWKNAEVMDDECRESREEGNEDAGRGDWAGEDETEVRFFHSKLISR